MRVYVAGPYSHGDVVLNIREAILASSQLLEAGHAPFCPHLTGLWHMLSPQAYERWLAYDLDWLDVCEALVLLPGYSPGADREVKAALERGIPVYHGVAHCLAAFGEESR